MSDKYSVVITEGVRKSVPVEVGQQVLEVPMGDSILLVPLPKDPDKVLKKYLGDVKFDRKARRKAEALMLEEVQRG
ncbi:MAG: hypothetical protein ACE5PO_06000 [Candidatus Bathyarchaeia archaeon]